MMTDKKSTENTGRQTRWSARQLALMGIFTAIGAVLSFIPIPLWPPASLFGITYDPSNVPAALGTLAMGTGPGFVIGIMSMVVHWMLTGDTVGTIINLVSVTAYVVPIGLIYRRSGKTSRLIVGLIVGSILSTALMIPANLIVWPQFFGMPFDVTASYILPLMLPFNALKALLNSVLTILLYLSLRKLIER